MTASEQLFLEKYGNKITASESWVIRFAEDFAAQESEWVNAELKDLEKRNEQLLDLCDRFRNKLKATEQALEAQKLSCIFYADRILELNIKLSSAEQALETEAISFAEWIDRSGVILLEIRSNNKKWQLSNDINFYNTTELYNLYKNRNK